TALRRLRESVRFLAQPFDLGHQEDLERGVIDGSAAARRAAYWRQTQAGDVRQRRATLARDRGQGLTQRQDPFRRGHGLDRELLLADAHERTDHALPAAMALDAYAQKLAIAEHRVGKELQAHRWLGFGDHPTQALRRLEAALVLDA